MRGVDIFINLAANASGVRSSRTHHADMLVDNVLCGLVRCRPLRESVSRTLSHSSSCVYSDEAPVPTRSWTRWSACRSRSMKVTDGREGSRARGGVLRRESE